jgi:hypothetical protein
MSKGLGRRVPKSFDHVRRMPLGAVAQLAPITVEKQLILPSWHKRHDQGQEGACVGFGTSMMLAILNQGQAREQGIRNPWVRYNPFWLWNEAKKIDEWPDSNPGDDNGTSVKAACQVLVTQGHVTWPHEQDPGSIGPLHQMAGVSAVRWGTSVDNVRSALASAIPCSIGINWYPKFADPEYVKGEYWIGRGSDWGTFDGSGHCVCIYGASDARQAVRIKNSWGREYPEVWMPYTALARLIKEDGEVALVTDR